MGVAADAVSNVIIWGNHSSTQFPDGAHGYVNKAGVRKTIFEAVNDDAWLNGEFITVSAVGRIFTHVQWNLSLWTPLGTN